MKSIAFASAIVASYISVTACIIFAIIAIFTGHILGSIFYIFGVFICYAQAQVFIYVSGQMKNKQNSEQAIEEIEWDTY